MLETVDYLNDPIHGRIGLTAIEQAVTQTPTFRRLDRITQLGLASLIFTGAKHTRASHCLGVLAVASKICNRLRFDDEETQNVRLAALLHDIGQYPLSHTIEQVYRQIGPPQSGPNAIYEDFPPDVAAATTLPFLARATGPSGSAYARDKDLAEHVILGRPDLRQVWSDFSITDDYLHEIARMIRGQGAKTLHKFLLDSEYDCDRLDYIQRDAVFAGVNYGLIDLEYLIENMDRRPYPPSSKDEVLTINRRKALHTFEHFLTGRYFMYSQIAFHRKVKGHELVARAAFHGLADTGIVYRNFEEIKSIIPSPEFLGFDDGYFWNHVRGAVEQPGVGEDVKRLCQMVINHQAPELADEEVILMERGENTPDRVARKQGQLRNGVNLAQLCDQAGISREDVAFEELSVDFLPIDPSISIADVLSGKFNREDIKMIPWLLDDSDDTIHFITEDEGSLLRRLAASYLYILRVFVLPNGVNRGTALKQQLDAATRIN